MNLPQIAHRFADIDGVRVFYRDTELVDALPMLLFRDGAGCVRRQLAPETTW